MKNTETRAFKDSVYGAFAEVARSLSSPRRLELLDLLIQGPRPVEALAEALGQSVGNTSQHLQVLKRSRLVETTRRGTTIEYRLAPGVAEVFAALRRLAGDRSPALSQAMAAYYGGADGEEPIDRDTLRRRLKEGSVVLLDVRPRAEFAHAHVSGATSIPIDELEARLEELPGDQLVVATCRGPYCVFAAQAVQTLRASGRRAVRFEGGVAEWALHGGALDGAGAAS
jgi:rhodanese-related sulfurtransferase